ncbi:MAG: restriction endonuclease [Candidatus Heimdallarchaeaceae archaeon]
MDDRDKPLIELALEYLKNFGRISHDLELIEGPSKKAVDFLIIIKEILVGVWVLDWKRSVGTDKIIHIERLIQRSNLCGGFVVANNFSPNARELATQTETLELIEKAEILYHT